MTEFFYDEYFLPMKSFAVKVSMSPFILTPLRFTGTEGTDIELETVIPNDASKNCILLNLLTQKLEWAVCDTLYPIICQWTPGKADSQN